MNFYHCGTSKAFSHTRRTILEFPSNSSRNAIIKKASRAWLGMNFYPCGTLAAHTNTRVLELLGNSRIPK
ncbi:hypothetical protein [Campylobacter sp.]|uniref:hypothetical protein n=1 Tax=Campylobacter sp. TaxID=205 RepID=UPI002A82531C|nr:hypothetical protein [Campylobacter sp.]MDY4803707.1 hypothetical protein [Campylobacter sp.]